MPLRKTRRPAGAEAGRSRPGGRSDLRRTGAKSIDGARSGLARSRGKTRRAAGAEALRRADCGGRTIDYRALVYENADCTLPKLTKSLKTLCFKRVSGQVGLPKFTRTCHLNRKQNGNIKMSLSQRSLPRIAEDVHVMVQGAKRTFPFSTFVKRGLPAANQNGPRSLRIDQLSK